MKWNRTAVARRIWFGAMVALFFLALFLHFNQLATNPGWYSDEGSDMDIARHLASGQAQYFAIGGTPLVAARVPLFHLMLAIGFQIGGYTILTARTVVALFSLAATFLLLLTVRDLFDKWLALYAAFIYVILPDALLYSRIAFAYNMQAFFLLVCWYGLCKFYRSRHDRWLLLAALSTAAAYLTALTGLGLIASVVLVALYCKPRSLLWAGAVMLTPGALYLGVLTLTAPTALRQDIALTLQRTSYSFQEQLFNLVSNFTLWFNWSPWIVLGVVGLFFLPHRAFRWITWLVFYIVLFNVMRSFPGAGDLNLHRYLEILPLIALGAAQFLLYAFHFIRTQLNGDLERLRLPLPLQRFTKSRWRLFFVYVVLGLFLWVPPVWTAGWDIFLFLPPTTPRSTRLDSVSVTEPADALAVTTFVNNATVSNDVVLASPSIVWLLTARAADFQQALAYEGKVTDNYGASFPPSRFLYDVSFANAKFVIVDRLWRGWAVRAMPSLQDKLNQLESWDHVKSQGDFDVYRNPNH